MSGRHVVAIYVREESQASRLTDRLAEEGLDPKHIQSSDELHRLLNHERVDAVLIENQLGGFLSGLEILERLHDELLKPITILIGEVLPPDEERLQAVKVDHHLQWDTSLDQIVDSLKSSFAVATHTGLRIPQAARQLVQSADYIRPIPQLVVKLTRYLHDEEASVTELAKDISTDARTTAMFLKLINSAAFGLRNKMTRVADAIAFLGIPRTASLILSATLHQSQSQFQGNLPRSLLDWFRRRSVICASMASAFGQRLKDVSPDTSYALGLLQDLGILVLAHAHQENYPRLLERCRTIPHLWLPPCEEQEFGFTHADVSAALLQRWELPATIVSLVIDHHTEHSGHQHSPTAHQFLHSMRIGEAVADMRDAPSPQRYQAFRKLLGDCNKTRPDDLKRCLAEAVAKAAESSQLFCIPVPDGRGWEQLIDDVRESLGDDNTSEEVLSEMEENNVECGTPSDGGELGRKILVIDDEPAIGRMIRTLVRSVDLEVELWDDLRDPSEVPADIQGLLCDVHLPGGTGIDFVRQLKSLNFDRPVIMLSGDRTRETVVNSIEAGIVDYILKPFTKQGLLEKLSKHGIIEPAVC